MRKGRKISEDEIPPPVALGKRPLAPQETTNRSPEAEPPAPRSVEPGIWRESNPILVPKVRAQGLPPHPAIVPLLSVTPSLRGPQANQTWRHW